MLCTVEGFDILMRLMDGRAQCLTNLHLRQLFFADLQWLRRYFIELQGKMLHSLVPAIPDSPKNVSYFLLQHRSIQHGPRQPLPPLCRGDGCEMANVNQLHIDILNDHFFYRHYQDALCTRISQPLDDIPKVIFVQYAVNAAPAGLRQWQHSGALHARQQSDNLV